MRIPSVDPTESRLLRKRLLEPFAMSKAGRWYVMRVSPKIDGTIGRRTGGRLTSVPGVPMLLLTHTGARSGIRRVTPLLYFTDGDDVVVMASNYGQQRHPAWVHNVKANPEVELEARGRRGRYRARVLEDGAERDRLWGLAKQLTAVYGNYEQRASERTIRVVVCSPLDPA